MIKNYDQSAEINRNPNWPYILDHHYRLLIIVGSRSDKNNVLLNLSKNQLPDIDTIYLFVKDSFESKYELLIKASEKVKIKSLKNPKVFTNHLQTIYDVYENLEDYNPTKNRKMLIVFDDMIAIWSWKMLTKENLNK